MSLGSLYSHLSTTRKVVFSKSHNRSHSFCKIMESGLAPSYEDVARKIKNLVRQITSYKDREVTLVFELDDVYDDLLAEVRKHILSDYHDSHTGFPCRLKTMVVSGPRRFLDKFGTVMLDLGCTDLPWDLNITFQPGQRLLRRNDGSSGSLPSASDVFVSIEQVKIANQHHEINQHSWSQTFDVVKAYGVSQTPDNMRHNLLRHLEGMQPSSDFDASVQKFMMVNIPGVLREAQSTVTVEVKLKISGEIGGMTSGFFRESMIEIVPQNGQPVLENVESSIRALSSPFPNSIKFTCGGKAFYVYKPRLLQEGDSFSPVIKSNFDYPGNSETRDSSYPVDDFDLDIVEQFMVYLQWGVVRNADRYAHDLALIAEKYQVARLLQLVEPYLVSEAVETSSWMDSQGRDQWKFQAFLKLCRLAGVAYLPILLTSLHYLLLDVEEEFKRWVIRDEWRAFLNSTHGMDFLNRRLKAVAHVQSDDVPKSVPTAGQ